MAGITISEFKGAVADLARPNRFLATIDGAAISDLGFTDNMQYLVMSTTLPGRTIGDIDINWQGMKIKLAGDPTFDDITLKFHVDYGFKVRDVFEAWLEKIAKMSTNERSAHAGANGGLESSDGYKAKVILSQLGRNGEVIAEYVLEGAYPKSVAAINLDMGTEGVEDFDVSFRYDYFSRNDNSGISPA